MTYSSSGPTSVPVTLLPQHPPKSQKEKNPYDLLPEEARIDFDVSVLQMC